MSKLSEKYYADEELERILIEKNDSKLTQKIHSTKHKFYERIRSLACVNEEQRKYFLNLLFIETKKNIKINEYDDEVESFLLNNITAIYRLKLMTTIERRI